ncbi:hypothetical protein XH89_17725 [Bradyrhizobium sp. CCBAU 53340]|nr:hypothetical protein XH89_17725 [Bradyrhizobium sp. CCBAU 53340]
MAKALLIYRLGCDWIISAQGETMRNLGITALAVALAGCASSSSDITPSYVSPMIYQSYNRQQLAMEAQSVSARAGQT